MKIHKEGFQILTGLIVFLGALNFVIYYLMDVGDIPRIIVAAASFIIFLLVLQFFRHPNRKIEVDEKNIIAPADGKVMYFVNGYVGI